MRTLTGHKGERGVATILIVGVLLVFLIFFLVLAIDFAYIYVVRGQMQNAADAGALAGADLLRCANEYSNDVAQRPARESAWKFACKNAAGGDPVYLQDGLGLDCDADLTGVDLNDSNDAGGDILLGNWNGTTFTRADPGSGTGFPVNSIRVVTRRTKDSAEATGGPIRLFFGQLVNWPTMDVTRLATAQGCIRNLSPISVNEYWMGDGPLGGDSPACVDTGRSPYGKDHVYPNSFVRPPCTTPNGTQNCSSPTEGNMNKLNGLKECPQGKNPGNPVPNINPNGPLPTNCTGAVECAGRPPGKPRAGRVFAIVGGHASGNSAAYNIYGLIDLDYRNDRSDDVADDTWYKMPGFIPDASSKTSPNRDVVAGYIRSGRYPHVLPTSVKEIYQPGYTTVSVYSSAEPYASTSYYTGVGVQGNDVRANFYVGGDYSGGKYAPGKKIIVAVYDGIVGGSGNQARTTIVGFARVTIYGYGKSIELQGGVPIVDPTSQPQLTMYGYIEDENDALHREVDELPGVEGFGQLVE